MYTAFAAVYDRLMSGVDYDGWADYYAALKEAIYRKLHKRQQAVLCTCDGVNYLTTPDQARQFFRAAFASSGDSGSRMFR